MLVFNPSRIIALRGIERPFTFLTGLGLSRMIAHNIIKGKAANLKIDRLEALCRALHCTPNDLFEWRDDTRRPLVGEHPLTALKRESAGAPLNELVKKIPPERMNEVEEYLRGL